MFYLLICIAVWFANESILHGTLLSVQAGQCSAERLTLSFLPASKW